MADKYGIVVGNTTFPAYTSQALTSQQFIVGGGGGTAKTGVPNAFDIYHREDNGKVIKVVSVKTYDAVMGCAGVGVGGHYYIFTTEGDGWRRYTLTVDREKVEKREGGGGDVDISHEKQEMEVRRRKRGGEDEEDDKEEDDDDDKEDEDERGTDSEQHEDDDNDEEEDKLLSTCSGWEVDIGVGELMQCDYEIDPDNFYHKVLRFSPINNSLFVGSSDGKLRVWCFNEMSRDGTPIVVCEAHKGEVDEVSVDPSGKRVVTMSRSDGEVTAWTLPKLDKISCIYWSAKSGDVKYKPRNMLHGDVEGGHSRLYVTYNPVKRGSGGVSYLVQFVSPRYEVGKSIPLGKGEEVCSLAVSSSGDFLAVGTLTGAVSIYISFSLQRLLYSPAAHTTFVTSLTLMPPPSGSLAMESDLDAMLFSFSPDMRIRMYEVRRRTMIPTVLVIIIFGLCLFGSYYLLYILGI